MPKRWILNDSEENLDMLHEDNIRLACEMGNGYTLEYLRVCVKEIDRLRLALQEIAAEGEIAKRDPQAFARDVLDGAM